MSDKIGEEYNAHISGVTEFGIYAEIDDNHCEGLIAVHNLGEEAFSFDDKNYCLVGRQTRRCLSLGDPIRIRVAKANLCRKQLDYELVEQLAPVGAPPVAFYQPFVNNGKKGAATKKSKTPKVSKKNGGKQKTRKRR